MGGAVHCRSPAGGPASRPVAGRHRGDPADRRELDYDAAAQLEAIDGGWRSVNGYSGYQPRHYQLLRDASEQRIVGSIVLSPFLARGDLNVIVHERSSRHVGFVDGQPGVQEV